MLTAEAQRRKENTKFKKDCLNEMRLVDFPELLRQYTFACGRFVKGKVSGSTLFLLHFQAFAPMRLCDLIGRC
jgi:hypothetical protein